MSTEHTSALIVGFSISSDELVMPFKTTIPEASHIEDRYNHKTGEKLEPTTVIDVEAHEAYVFEDEEYDDVNDLYEAMEQHIRCRINTHGDFFCGDLECSIQPSATAGKSCLTIAEVTSLEVECLRIEKAFAKYGIHLGSPTVFALNSVS